MLQQNTDSEFKLCKVKCANIFFCCLYILALDHKRNSSAIYPFNIYQSKLLRKTSVLQQHVTAVETSVASMPHIFKKSNSFSTTVLVQVTQRNKLELLKRARASAGVWSRINSMTKPIAGKHWTELSTGTLLGSTITRILMRNS